MRTQSLLVTRQCNQACGFCESVDANGAPVPLVELERGIEEAHRAGVRTIVVLGGEPLLHPDLERIVALCAAGPSGRIEVVLETNGTLVTDELATRLAAAGVVAARVLVVTTSPERHLALVGRRTHPRQILRGLSALRGAGIRVTVTLPLANGLPPAAARILGLKHALPWLEHFLLVPALPGARSLAPEQALAPAALAEELDEAQLQAGRMDVSLELSADRPIAPCIVDVPRRARRLLATQLGTEHDTPNHACSACSTCALRFCCRLATDQLARAAGGVTPQPIADATAWLRPGKSPGSRLRVLGAAEVETFFHVDYEYGVEHPEPTSRIGLVYRCNQVCTFCELADMDTDLPSDKVRHALDEARARGSVRVILTGGEPTLSPDLLAHVAYAREVGFSRIELQTNAVLLDRPGLAASLVAAGLTHAQVSLHGPDATISDRLTAAPGTHRRTLAGIDALLGAGVQLIINHLIFVDNCHLLVDFVELVHARWGQHAAAFVVQFHSARNEFVAREEGLRHIARYRDYAGGLRAAVDRARGLGLRCHDLQDPTGIPSLCVLGGDESYLGPILAQTERPRAHAWETDWLTRVDACTRCDAAQACMGVPRHYLALHGDVEFAPIVRPSNDLPPTVLPGGR